MFDFALWLFLAGLVFGLLGLAGGAYTLLWIGLALIGFSFLLFMRVTPINLRTKILAHLRPPKELQFFGSSFPSYRFADLHRSIQAFSKAYPQAVFLPHRSHFSLQDVLLGQITSDQLFLVESSRAFLPVAPDKEESFPEDAFWICKPQGQDAKAEIVLRLRRMNPGSPDGSCFFEVAAKNDSELHRIKDEILAWSVQHSIYRSQVLELFFEQEIMPDNYKMPLFMKIFFKKRPFVTQDDIVLEDEILQTLQRNVLDFHRHRKRLQSLGLPSKKGLLFYGPPGTGKTFTSQYLCHSLPDVTVFLVTGRTLVQMEKVCGIARLLQPSLVIMEDVDLVFVDREINLYSSVLGDFMDQLDGFQGDDAVTFLLTTNAIERLERAIKDRPGRISQCVFFGPPNSALCKRYLKHYLRPYPHEGLDLQRLAVLCEGTSQAFLKELVFRAVQVSLEKQAYSDKPLSLSFAHFQDAFDEMTGQVGRSAHAILGFRIQKD